MKKRLETKIKRKYDQRIRVCKMYLLLKAYEMYHMMQLHTECVKTSLNYKEAEELSFLMNEMFKVDTTADTFMVNPYDESDKALDYYNQLQKILESCSDCLRSSVMSFCKNVYHTSSIIGLKIDGFLFYSYYLENVLNYIDGFINFQTLRNSIVIARPWDKSLIKIDSQKFRHDFIKAEKLFETIFTKKGIRNRVP